MCAGMCFILLTTEGNDQPPRLPHDHCNDDNQITVNGVNRNPLSTTYQPSNAQVTWMG